ncbi:MAG: HAMP domain-containing protein [Lachnoclostridium sp.]|nr:HAMP domain-containing protein [Lachnoclostridium sp.]
MKIERTEKQRKLKTLSQVFHKWLFACVVIAFLATGGFTYVLQTQIAISDTERLLTLNLEDVKKDIQDASDQNLLDLTHKAAGLITETSDDLWLKRLAAEYDVSEINIVDPNGIITASTNQELIGFDMASGTQSAEFLVLLDQKDEYVQEYGASTYNSAISMKYAGVRLPSGGFLQVAYNSGRFQEDIDGEVVYAANNRHIGRNGMIIICDETFRVVSDHAGNIGSILDRNKIKDNISILKQFEMFEAEVRGILSYCAFTSSEGYYILAVLPQSEAMASRDISVRVLVCMEIVVFLVLFAYIYYLIKRLIVDDLQKVNRSLAKITDGDLDETVDVRTNLEFTSLSDDINATVAALKRYITEAETRIDQELEYARTIQYSALPSVFPPYPNRTEFEVYASMDTAKEVGGDFYDFYMIDESKLAFTVADVSGKGIPAAMFMMRAKTLLKSLAEGGTDLAEAFYKANNRLCAGNDAEMFVTVWMGILDVSNGHLEFVNAGHNPPVILRNKGSAEMLKTKANFVLGMMDDMPYKKHEIELQQGDMIFLYTDGLTEAQNLEDELFGETRLTSYLETMMRDQSISVSDLCQSVHTSVKNFAGKAEQSDDITMLALKKK